MSYALIMSQPKLNYVLNRAFPPTSTSSAVIGEWVELPLGGLCA